MANHDFIKLEYDGATGVLIASVQLPVVDKDEANAMYDAVKNDLAGYPEYRHFILDVMAVDRVSSYAIGIMMKTLMLVKKTKNYYVLIMPEPLLHEIMLAHPEMFDYLAVFQSRAEALEFLK
ncbi:MAG: hypothetical protein JXA20_05800 [Spirochaetes bacterium]|nr:hypothetical protein [Spirochaetota bacterium]